MISAVERTSCCMFCRPMASGLRGECGHWRSTCYICASCSALPDECDFAGVLKATRASQRRRRRQKKRRLRTFESPCRCLGLRPSRRARACSVETRPSRKEFFSSRPYFDTTREIEFDKMIAREEAPSCLQRANNNSTVSVPRD
jgi:hypothetical protein